MIPVASLPGKPSVWYAEFLRIARHEVFRATDGRGLPFTVADTITTLAHDAWRAIERCPREIDNVFGYARMVMRYCLLNMLRHERLRRWAHMPMLDTQDGDHNEESPDLVRLAVDPWDLVELSIAGSQLFTKHKAQIAPYAHTPKQETKTRQAEYNARERFHAWYLNSKRRRHD